MCFCYQSLSNWSATSAGMTNLNIAKPTIILTHLEGEANALQEHGETSMLTVECAKEACVYPLVLTQILTRNHSLLVHYKILCIAVMLWSQNPKKICCISLIM